VKTLSGQEWKSKRGIKYKRYFKGGGRKARKGRGKLITPI
jgi:hypothetical protein